MAAETEAAKMRASLMPRLEAIIDRVEAMRADGVSSLSYFEVYANVPYCKVGGTEYLITNEWLEKVEAAVEEREKGAAKTADKRALRRHYEAKISERFGARMEALRGGYWVRSVNYGSLEGFWVDGLEDRLPYSEAGLEVLAEYLEAKEAKRKLAVS
jgi:hypothetical protein